jgi:hypothetical protein
MRWLLWALLLLLCCSCVVVDARQGGITIIDYCAAPLRIELQEKSAIVTGLAKSRQLLHKQ